MPDRIRNAFKFCHRLSWYQCYMQTLQGPMYTEDPEYELTGPFDGMPQES